MKILYHILYPDGYGDDRFIYDGFKFAFTDLGHEVFVFTEKDDLERSLSEANPDLFITGFNIFNPTWAPTIGEFRKRGGRVAMRVGGLPKEFIESSPRYGQVVELIRSGIAADLYYSEIKTKEFKQATGKEYLMLPLAADKSKHFPAEPSSKYECDIIYIGANLPMKKEMFERRLYPLMKKYRVKTFGGDWDVFDKYILHPLAIIDRKFNLGGIFSRMRISRQVPLDEENIAYSSAKIALNFHEQYADHEFLNARGFKIPACGGFEICDYKAILRDYFNEDEMVMAKTDEEFFRAVDYYMAHEKERKAMQEKATKKALAEHLWHNRARVMLAQIS
jgi:spore maturation protein CgeB